jgi:hypothetical protein
VYALAGNRVTLTSPGPDKKIGTADDEELFHYEGEPGATGGSSGYRFNVGESPTHADYRKWLAKQGKE